MNDVTKRIFKQSVDAAFEQMIDSGTIHTILAHAIDRVTSFESSSSGEYSTDGYTMDDMKSRQRTSLSGKAPFVKGDANFYPATSTSPRSRIYHQTSRYGVAFGCIWIRKTTLHLEDDTETNDGKFESATSFIFYPAIWMKILGVHQGVEASMVNVQNGWHFQINPVCAVPESSPIFDLCRTGQIRAVEILTRNQHASVLDTRPRGWRPLYVSTTRMLLFH
jgi:hypothetical protein